MQIFRAKSTPLAEFQELLLTQAQTSDKADGSLKWTLDLSSTPANCADRFTDVLLSLCDFSDIFAGHPAASGLFTMVGVKQYKFLPEIMDQINAKLSAVGIKRLYSQSDIYHLS